MRGFTAMRLGALAALLIGGPAAGRAAETVFPTAAWQQAAPRSQGVDPERLAAAVRFLEENSARDGVKELFIVRRGRVVWEGPQVDKRHGVWSMTKSFTSTVAGLLIDDGKCTLDTPVHQFVPELAAAYPAATLRHFLSMTSGYRAVGDEPSGSYTHGPSQTWNRPSPEPLFSPPGSKYAYWDSAMNVLGLVLTRIAGEPIEELFRRRIAEPIGMDGDGWDWGDFGEIDGRMVNGGSGNQGRHIQITAREAARLGLLFLHRGNWQGRQLISRAWVEQATAVQVPASLPLGHLASGIDGRGVYGFNWWVNGLRPDGARRHPALPGDMFWAAGHNNNLMFVFPGHDLVVVRLGLDEEGGRRISDGTWNGFLRQLADACGAE
jgi:CubicO group peptidase (beta-lactamase class C family)